MDIQRYPAVPLVTSDPFLSIWSTADNPTWDDTRHWAGERKRITATITVDGTPYALLGRLPHEAATLTGCTVSATRSRYAYEAGGVSVMLSFRSPLLLSDLDLLSMPVTYVDFDATARDGKAHQVSVQLMLHDDICYNGVTPKPMVGDAYIDGDLSLGYVGRKRQDLLCCSGDHTTIDWGYAWLASTSGVDFVREGGHWALTATATGEAGAAPFAYTALVAYDDIASINYFGTIAKAWYTRDGRTILDAIHHCHTNRADIDTRCDALDVEIEQKALAAAGPAYAKVLATAYRQTICAHKLIPDEKGNAIFLSKENDSNGCLGTADVSYPSIPLYLIYAPELVRAMCRPILRFASMPIWQDDFAPHDVGRYPHATGQVYGLADDAFGKGLTDPIHNEESFPPLYLYRQNKNQYALRYQMPVEECGNMILMLAATVRADGEVALVREYRDLLTKWVRYLVEYGEDPGEQLCTDDFAGHLAHNVNLAFKAVFGIAAYAWMMERLGDSAEAAKYMDIAREMAKKVRDRATRGDHTSLTLDGEGWSLKYNTVWDILLGFGLLDDAFFAGETAHYLRMQNAYGVPLDSRADYTKSDWIMWCAALDGRPETVEALSTPIAKFLAESPTRKPFTDWYDTKTGECCHFWARSVQGGLFMPLLRKHWGK